MKFNMAELPDNLPSIEALRDKKVTMNASLITYWATQLECAAKMEGKCMDSESRHLELARDRKLIIDAIAADIRSKL